jgi:hypothetical protein
LTYLLHSSVYLNHLWGHSSFLRLNFWVLSGILTISIGLDSVIEVIKFWRIQVALFLHVSYVSILWFARLLGWIYIFEFYMGVFLVSSLLLRAKSQ